MKRLLYYPVVLVLAVTCIYVTDSFQSATSSEMNGYLIISSSNKSTLKPLIELRENNGLVVHFVEIEDIAEEPDPKVIRDFVKQHLNEWNLKFLLIVGTNSTIPMLEARPDPDNLSHMMVGNTYTDYYYATPSAVWDRDKDGNLGEYRDDGIASYEPEIYVGRIPFDDNENVSDCVSNICEFSSLSDAQRSKILFPAGILSYKNQLWDGVPMERGDGGEFSELIYEDFFRYRGFTPHRMYEKEGLLKSPYECEEPLNNDILEERFNDRFGFVCLTGHGSPNRVVRTVWNTNQNVIGTPEDDQISQPKMIHSNDLKRVDLNWGIVLAASCSTSNPRMLYNLGAMSLRAGCASYIGSTNVAWGPSFWKKPEDGGMDTIYYLFTKNITQTGMTTGQALADSLYKFSTDYFWGDTEDPPEASQMNIFNYNLYGDPAVTLIDGDESSWISINEPTIHVEAGGTALWEGDISGDISKNDRFQVLPAKEDMIWAFPEIEIDHENAKWRIEIEIPDDVDLGRREWLVYQYVDTGRIRKSLFLDIHQAEQADFIYSTIPENIAPYRTFEIDIKASKPFEKSNVTFKYDPSLLKLEGITFPTDEQMDSWHYTDNFFGMALIQFRDSETGSIASLHFRAKSEFEHTKIKLSNLSVTDEMNDLCSLPRDIVLLISQDEITRSRADFNHSGYVDMVDLSMLLTKFGGTSDDSDWDIRFDLDSSGDIDIRDYIKVIEFMTPTP